MHLSKSGHDFGYFSPCGGLFSAVINVWTRRGSEKDAKIVHFFGHYIQRILPVEDYPDLQREDKQGLMMGMRPPATGMRMRVALPVRKTSKDTFIEQRLCNHCAEEVLFDTAEYGYTLEIIN